MNGYGTRHYFAHLPFAEVLAQDLVGRPVHMEHSVKGQVLKLEEGVSGNDALWQAVMSIVPYRGFMFYTAPGTL